MTTTPIQAVSTAMIYTFLISRIKTQLTTNRKLRFISTCAKSEQEARHALLGLPLVFVSRTPAKAQEVAA